MWAKALVVTMLAALSLSAADSVTLGMVLRGAAPVPSAVRHAFELETSQAVRQSMGESDVHLAWRDEASLAGSESFDRLIVVSFHGDCSTAMPKTLPGAGPLGSTSTMDGRVLPFIRIDCGRVKAVLAESGGWPQTLIPAGILARALSRVAAHEIYHVLSERKHHDEDGLFKAAYSPADLLAPALRAERVPVGIVAEAGAAR